MSPLIIFRLWIDRLKMRLLQHEIKATSDDIQDCRLEGDWPRARVLSDYAIDLNTERRRLAARIKFLNAKRQGNGHVPKPGPWPTPPPPPPPRSR